MMKIKDTILPMNNLPTPTAKSVKNASKMAMVSFSLGITFQHGKSVWSLLKI